MDAYEATRIVFSRIQNLDPENAAKIMGLLLIQDHGEKEMIRLAFGPEALLHSVIVKARKDLGLLPSSSPATPSSAGVAVFSRQNSARLLPASLSWAAAAPFSLLEDLPQPEELPPPSPAYGGGDLIDELKLQDQLSFLDGGGGGAPMRAKSGELYYPEIVGDCRSPSSVAEGMLLPNSIGWGPNRRSGSIADLCLSSSDASGAGFGWRPCLYFARGYCKNGNACRFLHDDAAATVGGGKMDAVFEQELLLRSKSSRLVASAAPFPYSSTSTVPPSPSSPAKYMNFLLQHQNDSQRAAAAAATAAALMLNGGAGNDELHKFMGRPRAEFGGISNAGSRQIYLTFPADSTFREEDVSNYFSIYGPVQDVRIPYQQKRMFGFVTFVYPETVKLILAKGNPHFVCDARVLVKPYKEKGKVLDKKQPQADRLSFSGCSTPTGLDSPFDLGGGRMFYNIGSGGGGGGPAQDASLLRRLMEEQQQAELLQQAIELQGRRFELMELKTRNFSPAASAASQNPSSTTTFVAAMASSSCNGISSPVVCQPEGKSSSIGCGAEMPQQQPVINADDKEETAGELSPKEDIHFHESCTEHNLPDSPFASPTKASSFSDRPFSAATAGVGVSTNNLIGAPLLPPSSTLSSCFFQMPARFSSGHGAVGM